MSQPRFQCRLPHILCVLALIIQVVWFLPSRALAHDLPYTLIEVSLDENELELSFATHVPAYILGEPSAPLSTQARAYFLNQSDDSLREMLDAAQARLQNGLYVEVDGVEASIGLPTFPDIETLRKDALLEVDDLRPSAPIRLKLATNSTGTINLAAPELLGSVVVIVHRPDGEKGTAIMSTGELSGPISLSQDTNNLALVWSFIKAGVLHIMPYGLDHVLFVACLALAGLSIRALIILISTFTVAHTITLAMSTLGIISVPSGPVEFIIALSIVVVAAFNLFGANSITPRVISVFVLGLIHGLGFATVLNEFGLPSDGLVVALVAFNFGVEIGQLFVVFSILLSIGWWKNKDWYPNYIKRPASVMIGLVAAGWMIERAGAMI